MQGCLGNVVFILTASEIQDGTLVLEFGSAVKQSSLPQTLHFLMVINMKTVKDFLCFT